MLPHVFGRLNRRTLIAAALRLSAAAIAVALLVGAVLIGKPVRSLAGLYSFGVLITFTAAQIAVVKLRFSEPGLKRPFRVPLNLRIRGAAVPVAALVGAPLTFAVWIIALVTHSGVRIAGPIWLAAGAVVFVLVRRSRGETVMEQGAALTALHVIKVPLDQPLEAELTDEEERAAASLAEAKLLAEEHGVEVEGKVVRARALGSAIVEEAREHGVDLILMGSAPRWRRQSRFFSPTVDYVLRRAPCEVMVVAYPQGVLEEDEAEVVS